MLRDVCVTAHMNIRLSLCSYVTLR